MSSHIQTSSKSAPALTLPAELWLHIFDLVLESIMGPLEYPNYLDFPDINRHLRDPWVHRQIISPSRCDLRLVCRNFKRLLEPSPYLFMEDASVAIPSTTRAIFTKSFHESTQAYLTRLLAEPFISSRIVILHLPQFGCENSMVPSVFDFLCLNGHAFPAVRTLCISLGTPDAGERIVTRFWGRLNDAFPHLTCFTLRGSKDVITTYPDKLVTLENLEVIDWNIGAQHSIQFPRLRHVAYDHVPRWGLERFAKSPHLESLLLRSDNLGPLFEWSLLPNLRLLGVQAQETRHFPRLPGGHPLQHLYIYVGTIPSNDHIPQPNVVEELTWLKQTVNLFPTVMRISLEFEEPSSYQVRRISGIFRQEDLAQLGLIQNHSSRLTRNGTCVVIDRIVAGSQSTSIEPKKKGFRGRLDRFLRFTSRRPNS